MSIQKGRTAKKVAKVKPNGKEHGGDQSRHGSLSYASAATGIGRADYMAIAIDEIYRKAGGGEGVSVSQQASVMLNAIGKMLCLEGLKLRAGQVSKSNGSTERFFLEAGQ